MSCTNNNFGLIHYDFQLDNVFWDKEELQFNVIDFDDSMYHWYAKDIVRALVDIFENNEQESGEKVECFLNGYHSVIPIDGEMIHHFPKLLRFDRLYAFARLLWSLENSDFDNVPPWYHGLKLSLKTSATKTELGSKTHGIYDDMFASQTTKGKK